MFEGQRKDEIIINVYKKHWIFILQKIIFLLIALICMFLVICYELHVIFFYSSLLLLAFATIYLILNLIPLYYTYYAVTNQRIHYVNHKSIFNRSILDIDYDDIDNITLSNAGILNTIFNTSTINISFSAGELIIHKVKNSERMYNDIQDLLAVKKGNNA